MGERLSVLATAGHDDVDLVLRTLSYRERYIFKLRTGLCDGLYCSLAEVGHIFKISPTFVLRIYRRARKKFLHRLSQLVPEGDSFQLVLTSVLGEAKELPGSRAMLKTRALYLNGEWD